MKLWDCRNLLCFMHLTTLLFVSLIVVCINTFVRDRSSTEGSRSVTSVGYSCKTLKTSQINDILILLKRDELTPYGVHRIQQINAG